MKKSILNFAAVMVALSGSMGHAALINYDEAVNGDLPGFNSIPAPFTLDTAGTNTWRGSSTTPTATSASELDYFTINIAPGLEVVSYQLGLSNIFELPGSDGGSKTAVIRITAQDLIQRYATLQVGDSPLQTNPVPVPWDSSDPLAVRTNYQRGNATYFTWDWEVTLVAAPVDGIIPLPAGLPLLGGALVLLAGLRRKRAHSV